jgi:hypothetical protein
VIIALLIEPTKVEVAQSNQERVAEGVEIGLGLSIVLAASVTNEKEALSEGKVNYHVDYKENSHFSEHLNDQSGEVISVRPDSKVVEDIEPHKNHSYGFSCSLEQARVVQFGFILVLNKRFQNSERYRAVRPDLSDVQGPVFNIVHTVSSHLLDFNQREVENEYEDKGHGEVVQVGPLFFLRPDVNVPKQVSEQEDAVRQHHEVLQEPVHLIPLISDQYLHNRSSE